MKEKQGDMEKIKLSIMIILNGKNIKMINNIKIKNYFYDNYNFLNILITY